MLQRFASNAWLRIIFLGLLLAGCGGSDLDGFTEIDDLSLSELEVVDGGRLVLDGDEVINFDPTKLGPYSVELDDAATDAIAIRAVANDPDNTKLELVKIIERGSDEDNSAVDRIAEEIIALTSGETVSVPLNDITTTIFVRVSSLNNDGFAEYVLETSRLGTSAELSFVQVSYARGTDAVAQRATPEGDVIDTIEYGNCNVLIQPVALERTAEVSINGEPLRRLEAVNRGVVVGDNTFEIDVVSEDGLSTSSYTLVVNRAAPTAEELESDSTLRSISFSEGTVSQPFDCVLGAGVNSTRSNINILSNDHGDLAVTFETFAEGATFSIGTAVLSDTGSLQISPDNNQTFISETVQSELTSGTVVSGDIFAGLESGENNFFVVDAVSPDGDSFSTYVFNVIISSTRRVLVSTVEELQSALRNAQPNDEILVEPGDYLGTTSGPGDAAGSGDPTSHFYSSQNGTAEQPIVLRSRDRTAVLLGDDLSQNTVLKLSGNYWNLANIEVSGAQQGLVLDNADSNKFELVFARNLGGRGVHLYNGSSDNQFQRMAIIDVGQQPQEVGGEVLGESLVVGSGTEMDVNNSFRLNRFAGNSVSEQVDIKAASSGTFLEYNLFETRLGNGAGGNQSVVASVGEASVNYNHFEVKNFQGDASINTLIHASGDADMEAFQNLLELDNDAQSFDFAQAEGAASLSVADNTRDDEVVVTYSGNGVDQAFSTPVFQIQSTVDSGKCLVESSTDFDISSLERDTRPPLGFINCDSADDRQLWRLNNDGDSFVTIGLASSPTRLLNYDTTGAFFRSSLSLINEGSLFLLDIAGDVSDVGITFAESFSLRWQVVTNDGLVTFVSRANAGLAISEIEFPLGDEDDTSSDNAANIDDALGNLSREFRLVRVEQ